MKPFIAGMVATLAAVFAVHAAPAPPAATDSSGDPLPPGVLARLGTLHLRHACYALAWAPDGQTLASAGVDGSVRIWDAASGKEVRQCKGLLNVNVQALMYFPDGKTIASKANEGLIRIWDAATGREVRTLAPAQQQVAALAPGSEEGTLLELCTDNTVHIWDLTTGREAHPLELSRGKPQARLALSADGKRVAGWSAPDDVLTVWDAATGKELFHCATQLKNLPTLALAPDGKTVAMCGAPGQLVTWDVEAGKELHRYEGAGILQWLAFSPDGKSAAGLGAGPAVHLWSLAQGKDVQQFHAPESCGPSWAGVGGIAFSPDGKTLAAPQGMAIHLWDVDKGKLLQRFTGHTGVVEDVRFSPDGRRVVTCGKDGTARLWDVSLAKEIAAWAQNQGLAYSMVGLPDGKSVFAASPTGWQRVDLDAEKPQAVSLSGGAPAAVWMSGLTLSGDGKALLGAAPDRSVHLWDTATGKEIGALKITPRPFGAVALSPDGKWVAEGGSGAPIHLWDVAAAKDVRTIGDAPAPGQFRQTVGLNFSPDGKSLLHVSPGELTLYEVAVGRERMQITRPNGPVGNLFSAEGALGRAAFSPDGRTLAAGSSSGTVLLLDALNGRELTRLVGHANAVTSIAFSMDGKQLVAGAVDGVSLVWDVKEWTARPRPAAIELNPEKLSALWELLRDDDAGKAYRAILTLAAAPKASAPYLKERLSAKDAAAVEQVRGVRAVEALERSGAPEAAAALEDLARLASGAAMQQEAKAALERLAHRKAEP